MLFGRSFLLPLPNVLHAGSFNSCSYFFNLRNVGPLEKLVVRFSTDDDHPLFEIEKDVSHSDPGGGGRERERERERDSN